MLDLVILHGVCELGKGSPSPPHPALISVASHQGVLLGEGTVRDTWATLAPLARHLRVRHDWQEQASDLALPYFHFDVNHGCEVSWLIFILVIFHGKSEKKIFFKKQGLKTIDLFHLVSQYVIW